MLGLLRWTFWITVWVIVAAFFHYTLPQVDIVRITNTYEKRIDPGENALFWAQADVGTDGTLSNRDVFFIQSRRVKGDVMVYRNEDTGWGWPPYLKFDTTNLQAEAADMKSIAADPRYVLIVTLDEPVETSSGKPRRTAGWTAVPIAAEMIRRVAPLLGMRPAIEPAELAGITLTSSN